MRHINPDEIDKKNRIIEYHRRKYHYHRLGKLYNKYLFVTELNTKGKKQIDLNVFANKLFLLEDNLISDTKKKLLDKIYYLMVGIGVKYYFTVPFEYHINQIKHNGINYYIIL